MRQIGWLLIVNLFLAAWAYLGYGYWRKNEWEEFSDSPLERVVESTGAGFVGALALAALFLFVCGTANLALGGNEQRRAELDDDEEDDDADE